MKGKRLFWRICPLMVFLLAGVSCEDPVHFPKEGVGNLRFSEGVCRFDTLFSNVSSTTAWMIVYNAGQQELTIDSVWLKEGVASVFRFSLDGLPGPVCYDYVIPARDSVFLFVEMTAPKSSSGYEFIEDALMFRCADGLGSIRLEAVVRDAVMWRGYVLDSDTLLASGTSLIVFDSLVVAENACLKIDSGVELFFHDKARLTVYGSVEARGSAERPVVFRGDRLDQMLDGFSYDKYPGQWHSIYLGGKSRHNVFDHVVVRGGSYGIICDSAEVAGEPLKLSLTNSVIFNMAYSCLYCIQSDVLVANSVLANSGDFTVLFLGGRADMVHCTVANYQVLVERGENTPALVLANAAGDGKGNTVMYPLEHARIVNSIVYGSRTEELGFSLYEGAAHDFIFDHCLLRSTIDFPDSVSVDNVFNGQPAFAMGENYEYDFHIDSISAACGMAGTLVSQEWPLDLDGRSRLLDGQPDAGAYEAE